MKFLIVGGHAVAANGHPRATLDIDVFVEPSKANASKLAKALIDFGFPALASAADAFAGPDARMATIGKEPLRIDIMNAIDGVGFKQAWASKISGTIDGLQVPFIGLDALLANKRSTGRVKDALDVEALDEIAKMPTARKERVPKKKA